MDMFGIVGVVVADVGHMDGFGWTWMIIVWVTLVAVIASVAWLVTRGTPNSGERREVSALAILAERYARGEIDDDEYRRRADQIRAQH